LEPVRNDLGGWICSGRGGVWERAQSVFDEVQGGCEQRAAGLAGRDGLRPRLGGRTGAAETQSIRCDLRNIHQTAKEFEGLVGRSELVAGRGGSNGEVSAFHADVGGIGASGQSMVDDVAAYNDKLETGAIPGKGEMGVIVSIDGEARSGGTCQGGERAVRSGWKIGSGQRDIAGRLVDAEDAAGGSKTSGDRSGGSGVVKTERAAASESERGSRAGGGRERCLQREGAAGGDHPCLVGGKNHGSVDGEVLRGIAQVDAAGAESEISCSGADRDDGAVTASVAGAACWPVFPTTRISSTKAAPTASAGFKAEFERSSR
jgi:hypothetical protein